VTKKKKVRRVVVRKSGIPTLSELKTRANDLGMTVKEYVDFIHNQNRRVKDGPNAASNRFGDRDQGPEPYKMKRGTYNREKVWGNEK
jgi:hypothetical protein